MSDDELLAIFSQPGTTRTEALRSVYRAGASLPEGERAELNRLRSAVAKALGHASTARYKVSGAHETFDSYHEGIETGLAEMAALLEAASATNTHICFSGCRCGGKGSTVPECTHWETT